jgi:hypothetical protein
MPAINLTLGLPNATTSIMLTSQAYRAGCVLPNLQPVLLHVITTCKELAAVACPVGTTWAALTVAPNCDRSVLQSQELAVLHCNFATPHFMLQWVLPALV